MLSMNDFCLDVDTGMEEKESVVIFSSGRFYRELVLNKDWGWLL